ncbi:glycoside hydrolase family 13 protein [Vallitalea pronyensis]|uniref:Glycoside hydrolase family 13 protein n=1 Tax=Vallitalea pronyensis TaxID=1348613 RepID=A0A8J8MGD4_9FIRM|nr:glycoside hydrolase family 13 protein [Vallitalea pronyensis]QUI20808.1 glycoside hydrolase family 13 protein [Vallitalea pronyensis]
MKPLEWDRQSLSQKLLIYGRTRRPILEQGAVFSDGTSRYRIPSEPEPKESVTIRLRTKKDNVDDAYLICGETRIKMLLESSDHLFDYYQGILLLQDEHVTYYFELHAGLLTCFYNRQGIMKEPNDYFHFRIAPGFKTPDWAKGAVFYQIFVDRFYNGDPSNDVVDGEYYYVGGLSRKITDWYAYPGADSVRDFYGGDLQGIIDKLDYIQGLGVDVIYLNPVFVSPSNHKYDTQDYDYVDPHYGRIVKDGGEVLGEENAVNEEARKYIQRTANKENLEASNALFVTLIEKVHERGMRLILDGVFNHCGSFNKWLDREKLYKNQEDYEAGAFETIESPYQTFFHFQKEDGWPDNGNYDGWWGYETLPKLNYEGSTKLYEYIMTIAKKWVSPPFNADGWRLDVAADLGYTKEFNHQFWRDFRQAVKSANKDAIILAEHYEDARDWLIGDQWDTIMNYDAFMEPVTWFLTGLEKHSDEYKEDLLNNHCAFFDGMTHHMQSFLIGSLLTSMNELSNHDHSRFLTRTNHQVGRTGTHGPEKAAEGINKGIMKEAVVIQMTWPGAPTIYYGDEVGVCGWTDPDNRRTYPWGKEDLELLQFHKDIIGIHKSYSALKTGSLKYLYGEHGIIGYGRFDDQARIAVAVNNNDQSRTIDMPVWQIGVEDGATMEQILLTTETDHSTKSVSYVVKHGSIQLALTAFSAIIVSESKKTS